MTAEAALQSAADALEATNTQLETLVTDFSGQKDSLDADVAQVSADAAQVAADRAYVSQEAGNLLVLVDDSDPDFVEVALGTGITVAEGTDADGIEYVDVTFPA